MRESDVDVVVDLYAVNAVRKFRFCSLGCLLACSVGRRSDGSIRPYGVRPTPLQRKSRRRDVAA